MRGVAFFISLILVSLHSNSQCIAPRADPTDPCGTGTLLTDGASINSGQTFYYNGPPATLSNISMNGGVLLICSSLTINNFNFNSGVVSVKLTGSITYTGSFNVGSSLEYHNSGNSVFNSNVSVQGSSNFIENAPTGTMTVNGDLLVFNSGTFINNGTTTAGAVTLNGGAIICFGPGSESITSSIQNNATNPVSIQAGIGCLRYTTTFTGNAPLTATPGLMICQATGASAPDAAVIGTATVITNCASCSSILPLKLISFRGNVFNGQVNLDWITAYEENVRSFIIERSNDGSSFDNIGEVQAFNRPSVYHFGTNISSRSFFRLKMIDTDGRFTYSPVILLNLPGKNFEWKILSNPVHSFADLSISVPKNQTGELLLMNNIGMLIKKIPVVLPKGNNSFHLELGMIPVGQYYLYYNDPEGKTNTLRFVKL
jgi:hypothetical protein